jgi:hypothetical protein
MRGEQLVVASWLHVPLPVQCDSGWNVVPVHDTGAPHVTVAPACWQAPLTQTPVLPQGGLAAQLGGSAVLSATFAQVPLPLTLHDWQAGQLEVMQQTPSTQLSLAHSFAATQVAPFAFFETQLPGAPGLPVQ